MSLATKNVATVLVGSALVLAASFAVATPAKADLLSDLQAQVQALLAQIASLQGGSTTGGTGAGCYAFTMTHQMGDTGGEVMQIQKFLNSHGAQVAATGAGSPGNESNYFGALTRAAVAKWQAANGVSPAAGYWGPVTRAKVAQVCASTPTTGTPTTPGGSTGLQGTAGTAIFTSTSEDVEDTVQTGSTEKVAAFKVEASGSDLRVTNVRVKFDKDSETVDASDFLTAYFSEVSIWANGQKIGSMAASSFTRDSAGVYSASIPVDQIVRMGSGNKVTFHVGATAASSIDSDDIEATNDWTVSVTQVRYTDASGAVLFEDPSDDNIGTNNDVEVERLSSSSDVKLRMGEGSGNPKAGNVKVSESNTSEITLAEFTLKAEGTDMTFDSFNATSTVTGVDTVTDIVQTYYLMRGSTRIAEVTPTASTATTSGAVAFDLDDLETISSGNTQTYRIVAKVASICDTTACNSAAATTFTSGDTIELDDLRPDAWNINAKAADGKTVTERAGSSVAYRQTLFTEGIQVTKVGESFSANNPQSTSNTVGEYKVTLRVTNFGSDDVYVPLNAAATTTASSVSYTDTGTNGIVYYVVKSGDTTATTSATAVSASLARVSGGTEQTNSVRISGGSSADFQLTVSFNPDAGVATAQWRVGILSAGWNTSDSATSGSGLRTYTTPIEDFRTAFYTVNN